MVEIVYNSSPHSAIGMSPFEAAHGYKPSTPSWNFEDKGLRSMAALDYQLKQKSISLQVIEMLKQTRQKMIDRPDKNKESDFKVGDLVLLKREGYFTRGSYKKIKDCYLGPFKIVKMLGDNAVELDIHHHKAKLRTFNVCFLKKYVHREQEFIKSIPRTPLETKLRINEIDQVLGFDNDYLYCTMRDCDPRLTCTIDREFVNEANLLIKRKVELYTNSVGGIGDIPVQDTAQD